MHPRNGKAGGSKKLFGQQAKLGAHTFLASLEPHLSKFRSFLILIAKMVK
jgi:hypothetical protein